MNDVAIVDNSIHPTPTQVQPVVARSTHFLYQQQQQHAYDPANRPGFFPCQHQNANAMKTVLHSSPTKLPRLPEESEQLLVDSIPTGNFVYGHDHTQCEIFLPTSVNQKLIAPTSHPRSPIRTSVDSTSDFLISKDRQEKSSYLDGFDQHNGLMERLKVDKKHCSVAGNDTNSSGKSERNYQNSSRLKGSLKRKLGGVVQNVSEWRFPPCIKNKYDFVTSSLRQGVDPNIADEICDKPKALPYAPLSTRKPKTVDKGERIRIKKDQEPMRGDGVSERIHPVVTDAEFDNRFLRYELSPSGEQKKEVLVRSLSLWTIPIKNYSQAKEAWENNHVEEIADEPSRSKTSSRVGPRYQARIPSKLPADTFSDSTDRFLHGYDTLWDPQLALQAERRGEDLSGFLGGDRELCDQELLISILHKNGYRVKKAQIEFDRMQRLENGLSSSKLNKAETRKFENLIHKRHKDFSGIAKSIKRKKSDCLIHYYNWKASNRQYQRLKKTWNDRYCSVCNDGGELIICDGCHSNFHMACAKPPLTTVPEGNWFCHSCRHMKRTVISPLSSLCTGKKRFST